VSLGGPRLGDSFSGAGSWVPDGDPPRSIMVTPLGAYPVAERGTHASWSALPWLAPPEIPDAEVVHVSVTPGQVFKIAQADCTWLTTATETSKCGDGFVLDFDYNQSVTGRAYSADLIFRLRATCPESLGRRCIDEHGAAIPPGQQVTWTSSIRLTTTGCDLQCLLSDPRARDGAGVGSPDPPVPPDPPVSPDPPVPTDTPVSPDPPRSTDPGVESHPGSDG
jgi:hypothetical protein